MDHRTGAQGRAPTTKAFRCPKTEERKPKKAQAVGGAPSQNSVTEFSFLMAGKTGVRVGRRSDGPC